MAVTGPIHPCIISKFLAQSACWKCIMMQLWACGCKLSIMWLTLFRQTTITLHIHNTMQVNTSSVTPLPTSTQWYLPASSVLFISASSYPGKQSGMLSTVWQMPNINNIIINCSNLKKTTHQHTSFSNSAVRSIESSSNSSPSVVWSNESPSYR